MSKCLTFLVLLESTPDISSPKENSKNTIFILLSAVDHQIWKSVSWMEMARKFNLLLIS